MSGNTFQIGLWSMPSLYQRVAQSPLASIMTFLLALTNGAIFQQQLVAQYKQSDRMCPSPTACVKGRFSVVLLPQIPQIGCTKHAHRNSTCRLT